MNILVTVASRHGATGEMGEIIAGVLRDAGLSVDTRDPQAVDRLEGYDAVVLGSAVYAGRWLHDARHFAQRHHVELRARPVWLFASGPVGVPLTPSEESPDGRRLALDLEARGHRTFPGRIDPNTLSWVERAITGMVAEPDDDFRDWEAIRAYADEIVASLTLEEAPA